MKIAVIGSTGRAGSRIANEALTRGHSVYGYSRKENKDLFDLTQEDLKDFDVVISAFATWGDQKLHESAAKHLDQVMHGLKSRWVAVGGAGSLFVGEGLRLMDTESFPEEYKAVAAGMTDALIYLQEHGKSNWSFFSPSAVFEPGERTGGYVFGKDNLLVDSKGESHISMEDYAIAMLDAVEQGLFVKERFTAVRK